MDENPAVSQKLCEAQIPEVWAAVVGAAMVSLTRSVEIRDGILHVAMSSSVARQELFMRREELKKKINERLGSPMVRSVIVK